MSQTTFAFFSFFVAPTLNSPNFFSNKIKKWKKIIHFYSNRDKKMLKLIHDLMTCTNPNPTLT